MKNFLRTSLGILICIGTCLFTTSLSFAQDLSVASGKPWAGSGPPANWQGGAEGGWYVNVDIDDTLNIRSLPNHKSTKIGAVERGQEVHIIDNSDNGWKFIETNTVSGWVNGAYLSDNPVIVSKVQKDFAGRKDLTSAKIASNPAKPSPIKSNLKLTNSSNSDFEAEFKKYREFFRNKDACYRKIKRRSALVSLAAQYDNYDPLGYRNLKAAYDECVGSINFDSFAEFEAKVRKLAVTDTQKVRFTNFTREYIEITEEAAVLIRMGQAMGVSFE